MDISKDGELLLYGTDVVGVYRSEDGGNTWIKSTFTWDSNGITGILCGGQIHHNVYNPDLIYFGLQDYNGCVTTNGGKTFQVITSNRASSIIKTGKQGGFETNSIEVNPKLFSDLLTILNFNLKLMLFKLLMFIKNTIYFHWIFA